MQIAELPSREAAYGIPAENGSSFASDGNDDYEMPALSPSQKAFAEDPQGFIARLEERANTLFESGYYVYPTGEAHCFAVVHHVIRKGAADAEYFVRPLMGTCTCPFFAWQEKGDYLSGQTDQSDAPVLVPCKHLRGLSRLVRKTRNWLYATGQSKAYCALTLPWSDTAILRWKQGHRNNCNGIGHGAVCTSLTYRGVRERRKKRPSSPRPTIRKEVSE